MLVVDGYTSNTSPLAYAVVVLSELMQLKNKVFKFGFCDSSPDAVSDTLDTKLATWPLK